MSNVGTIINQDYKTIKFTIKKGNNQIFDHYKFSDLEDIKFPILNKEKIEKLYNKYNIILSPRLVGKLAIYLFENDIKLETLKLNINPYLYKAVQSNLYDDEGTTRIKSEYKGLSGGSILNNKDSSCGYYYNFDKNEFSLNIPDLEIKPGNNIIKNITENDYLLAEDFDEIKILANKVIINTNFTLFSNKKDQGYLIKKILLNLENLKDIERITTSTKVSGLETSSIKAPYIYLGKDYE